MNELENTKPRGVCGVNESTSAPDSNLVKVGCKSLRRSASVGFDFPHFHQNISPYRYRVRGRIERSLCCLGIAVNRELLT